MKENQTSAKTSSEQRRSPRYRSLAGIRINGYEGQALLKDINAGGFCMQSRTFVSLTPGVRYTINITPEANLAAFTLVVEVCWVRSDVSRFEAGFALVEQPKENSFETYINYLKSHKTAL
jgi:hypothetical protein